MGLAWFVGTAVFCFTLMQNSDSPTAFWQQIVWAAMSGIGAFTIVLLGIFLLFP